MNRCGCVLVKLCLQKQVGNRVGLWVIVGQSLFIVGQLVLRWALLYIISVAQTTECKVQSS